MYKQGQKVQFKNETFLFDKVSARGGNGECAFIQYYPATQYKMKQVKISDLKAL